MLASVCMNWMVGEGRRGDEKYVYIENRYGTFARFYGPDRKRLSDLFLIALRDEIKIDLDAVKTGEQEKS